MDRFLALIFVVALSGLLVACGGSAAPEPVGTPVLPVVDADATPTAADPSGATPTISATDSPGATPTDVAVGTDATPVAAVVDREPPVESSVTPAELIASLKERLGAFSSASDADSRQRFSSPATPASPELASDAESMPMQAGGSVMPGPPGPAGVGFPPEAGGLRNPNEAPLPLMYFEGHGVNPFVDADEDRLSTFALDGDTGSFEMAKLYLLGQDALPPEDSVRVEEWVNSFDQDYAAERDGLGLRLDGMMSPFGADDYRLMRVGVASARPDGPRDPVTLIFVLDISGSMAGDDRLGVAKLVMVGLSDQLTPEDRVALVTYGDAARVDFPLAAASGSTVSDLVEKIAGVHTEGATNLAEGMIMAYRLASEELDQQRKVRVVVLSDGVGNIGATGPDTVLALVDEHAQRDATVTAVGVGVSGNYNDVMMEALANRGNGTYHYLRGDQQAGAFLLENAQSVFREVARDARIQVEFNPDAVRKYRLIGYENRAVADADFRDDSLDFGEPGFARDVTALYELRLEADVADDAPVATVYLRWEDGVTGEIIETQDTVAVADVSASPADAAAHLVRSAAVAEFAELLRKSYWAQCGTVGAASELLAGRVFTDGGDLDELLDAAAGLFEPYCAS